MTAYIFKNLFLTNFFTILDTIHITSHIFPSLFMLIISVVRVKMFHISKIMQIIHWCISLTHHMGNCSGAT